MTTMEIINLPEYIQKYIIRILSEYINSHNSKFRAHSSYLNFESELENEVRVKKEIKSISLVNKLWFNTFSNYLNISNDFVPYRHAYTNTSSKRRESYAYSKEDESVTYIVKRLLKQQQSTTSTSSVNKLLKDENITELMLNMDHWDIEITSSDIPVLLFKLINKTIKDRYINLKRISVSNTNDYWILKHIEFDNIRIREYNGEFEPIPSNIKEIDTFEVGFLAETIPIKEAYQFFVNLNSIKAAMIGMMDEFSIKSLYETISAAVSTGDGNVINCLSKTEYMLATVTSIEEFYYLLKLAPGIKELHLYSCIDGFNYHLNRMDGGDSQVNSGQVCECFNHGKNDNFLLHWDNVIQLLVESKSLQSLKMEHQCDDQSNLDIDEEDANSSNGK